MVGYRKNKKNNNKLLLILDRVPPDWFCTKIIGNLYICSHLECHTPHGSIYIYIYIFMVPEIFQGVVGYFFSRAILCLMLCWFMPFDIKWRLLRAFKSHWSHSSICRLPGFFPGIVTISLLLYFIYLILCFFPFFLFFCFFF